MAILTDDLTNYTTVSNTRIQTLLEDLETRIEGNLVGSDLAAAAEIPNSKLANSNYEFDVNIPLQAVSTSSSNDVVGIAAFPYDSGGGTSYTVLGVDGVVGDDATTTAPTLDVCFGNLSGTLASPTETNTSVVANEVSGVGTSGSLAQLGSASLSVVSLTQSDSSPKCFYVRTGTTAGSGGSPSIVAGSVVTVRVRRTDGLRGA